MIERIRHWYRGTCPTLNDPDRPGLLIYRGHAAQQPPFARMLGAAGRFWRRRWPWIVGTAVTVILAIVSA